MLSVHYESVFCKPVIQLTLTTAGATVLQRGYGPKAESEEFAWVPHIRARLWIETDL